jgi:hypothetical protein
MEDMVKTLETGKVIPMKFNIGEENLSVILSADSFSVSVEKKSGDRRGDN